MTFYTQFLGKNYDSREKNFELPLSIIIFAIPANNVNVQLL